MNASQRSGSEIRSDASWSARPFASPADHAECRRIHRKFGTTYFFASRRFPRDLRTRVHALYGFVRLPDEWVDNPNGESIVQLQTKLNGYRSAFLRGMDGVKPQCAVLRAFCDSARDASLPLEEPLLFLGAMEQDLTTTRYETYEELRHYMRGSAAAVGIMMCGLLKVELNTPVLMAATALAEAMQLTNFLRDIGEDFRRGRIYIPQEDLSRFPGSAEAIRVGAVNAAFTELMAFEISRARSLYQDADLGTRYLRPELRPPIKLARILYSRILDRIEQRGYDVFSRRARTSSVEKLLVAIQVHVRPC